MHSERTLHLQRAVLVLLAALALYAGFQVHRKAWVCDDSFISFRYADHVARGDGLVFNRGERVEGYTNLSWTLLMALAIVLGLSPEAASKVLGLFFHALLVATLLIASWHRVRRRGSGAGIVVPLAAALVLTLDDFHVWATGGLETSMFAALALLGLMLARGQRRRALALAGVVLGLCVTTRPDGMIFVVVAGVWIAVESRRRRSGFRRLAAFALPVGVIIAALVTFKLVYYGELLPTSFYAKSAANPYYSQGVRYLALFLVKNWSLVPLGIVLHQLTLRSSAATSAGRDAWLFGTAGGFFLLYVVHSGGDYMFARRLIPALPLLFLAAEGALERLAPRRQIVLLVVAVVAALLPYPLYNEGRQRVAGISDEPQFYPAAALEARKAQAEIVGRVLRGTGARVLIGGGMCSFAYYSRLPYVVEMTGLTQLSLARLPAARRDLPGHEKRPNRAWIEDNEIHLLIHNTYPPVHRDGPLAPGEIVFSNLAAGRFLMPDDDIFAALEEYPEVHYKKPE